MGAGALREGPADKVLHVCGRFHVEHGLGIPEHLDRYLLEEHCDSGSNSDHLKTAMGSFRTIAKTAVFLPVEFNDGGGLTDLQLDDPLLTHAADWVILTDIRDRRWIDVNRRLTDYH